jgi:hypothetical protein
MMHSGALHSWVVPQNIPCIKISLVENIPVTNIPIKNILYTKYPH